MVSCGCLSSSLTRSAANIQQPTSDRDMEGVLSLEPPQRTDWLNLLPEDVQRMMLGFLDLRTLCTARLVCERLRKYGAEHFKSLDCTPVEGPPTTDFTQFSGMAYLAVTVSHESHLQSLAHPVIGPFVTHVSLEGFPLRLSLTAEVLGAALMRLPKLRSVSLPPLGRGSRLPLLPPRLENVKITDRYTDVCRMAWKFVEDASPLTQCSQLTSLVIDVVGRGTLMKCLPSLRNLRSLDLRSSSSALELLSTLTALTSLKYEDRSLGKADAIYRELGRLTGLSRLALAHIKGEHLTHQGLMRIAQLTNLTCVDMRDCRFAASVEGSTALAPLTALVSVNFTDAHCCHMPCLSGMQVEALESLTLGHVSDASILQWATKLTHLDLSCKIQRYHPSLSQLFPVVVGMSRLRSLRLILPVDLEDADDDGPDDRLAFRLDAVLRACTMLTELHYGPGKLRLETDLKACAALPGLRSLTFSKSRILTPACLPALQAMSGLSELSLLHTGISVADVTPDVLAAFDAERRQLGWPLLKLCVVEEGQRFERLGNGTEYRRDVETQKRFEKRYMEQGIDLSLDDFRSSRPLGPMVEPVEVEEPRVHARPLAWFWPQEARFHRM